MIIEPFPLKGKHQTLNSRSSHGMYLHRSLKFMGESIQEISKAPVQQSLDVVRSIETSKYIFNLRR